MNGCDHCRDPFGRPSNEERRIDELKAEVKRLRELVRLLDELMNVYPDDKERHKVRSARIAELRRELRLDGAG
jgi:hypothetical protein